MKAVIQLCMLVSLSLISFSCLQNMQHKEFHGICADEPQGQIEAAALAVKILLKLHDGTSYDRIFAFCPFKTGESVKSFDNGLMVPALCPVTHDELIVNGAYSQLTAGGLPLSEENALLHDFAEVFD